MPTSEKLRQKADKALVLAQAITDLTTSKRLREYAAECMTKAEELERSKHFGN